MPTSSLVAATATSTPISVKRNDSTPSCVTLNLKFADKGPLAIKSEFNYLDINISDACNPPSVSRISRQQLTSFFNLTANALAYDYDWDIPVSALPNGDAGSKYILSVLEEFNDGSAHEEHDVVNFTKSGAPAAPTISLKTLGDLAITDAQDVPALAPVGNSTASNKLQGRADTTFRASLDQSNGGSAISKIYYTHIYTKEVKKVTVVAGTEKNVTNKALNNNVATLTSAAHGFVVGDTVKVTEVDATTTIFNGEYKVTSVTVDTFSYAKTNANVTSVGVTGKVKKQAEFILEDQLTKLSGNQVVSSNDNADGFVDIKFSFPGAKIDSFQSTWIFTENSDGKNSPISNVIKTTNTNRVVINPSSIVSASFDRLDGVSVTLAENFYTQSSDSIKYSVLAKKSTDTKYSTTDVRNIAYDPTNAPTSLIHVVSKIYKGSALADLDTNTVYDFVIAAVKSSDDLPAVSEVQLGRNNDVTSLSEISSIVKGQELAGGAEVASIAASPTLTSVFTLFRLTDPQNEGGLNIRGDLAYTPTPVDSNGTDLKNHQYWELSKITNGVSKVLASDFTQLDGTSPVPNTVLRKLTSFTVRASDLDSESSYKLSVYLALPVLPSMLSVFPSLKDNKSVRANGKNLFFLLDSSSPQSISFKDLIDPSDIDKVHKVSVNSGTDANDNMFLGVCMTHVPLSDDGIEVKKIRFEVSTSDTFVRTFFISDRVLAAIDLPSATRFVDVDQASDIAEYQQLYIYENVEASAATAATLDSSNSNKPYKLCEGAAYHVRVSYICSQVGFQGSTQSSNFSIGSTEFHSEAPPKGPSSVTASANMDTKIISGQYFLPSTPPAGLSVQSVRVDLFGSDASDKSNPLKTMNLVKGPTQTAIPNTFKFDLSNDKRQTDSYNIFVTINYNRTINNTFVESTPAHTTATFPSAVEIVKYEIVSSSGNPPKVYDVTEIANVTTALRLRVTVAGSVNSVVALLPHSSANHLILTRVGLTNEWQSGTFTALSTTLEYEPVIIAVGSNGAGYDLKCEV